MAEILWQLVLFIGIVVLANAKLNSSSTKYFLCRAVPKSFFPIQTQKTKPRAWKRRKSLEPGQDFLGMTRAQVEHTFTAGDWQREVFDSFAASIMGHDKAFPCTFATRGFKSHEHLYCFLGYETSDRSESIEQISKALLEFLPRSHALGPNCSLVVFCKPSKTTKTVREYHESYWNTLSQLHRLDKAEWPKDIPKNLDNEKWCFSFGGEAIFTVAMTPAHEKRRSRHANTFCILFQPKWVFDVALSTPLKRMTAVRKIRDLISDYDDLDPSADLQDYGAVDSRDYKQYFLMDDNESASLPFAALGMPFNQSHGD